MLRTKTQWYDILCKLGVKATTAALWCQYFELVVQPSAFSAGEAEIDDFVSQVLHESGMLEVLAENLNYSADALIAKFARHRISEADARKYGRINGKQPANQKMIACLLYGGEWGLKSLGNKLPSDGWDFRGSGPIQVTGRANFAELQMVTGLPLLNNPDLLRKPSAAALRVCIAWWEGHVPDSIMGNTVRVRQAVNGGTIGLDDTAKLAALATKVLT